MKEPEVTVQLDRHGRAYEPGELLSGSYRCDVEGEPVRRIEVSVLWRTVGKGDEDFGIHFFDHYSVEEGDELDSRATARFTTQLPHAPLSYHGAALKIEWLVRVRLFLERGGEVLGERSFRLGHVPPAREFTRPAKDEADTQAGEPQ